MEKLKLEYWFGLDRASFMVLPRVFLEQMPDEWQYKMHDLLREFEKTFDLSKAGVHGTLVQGTDKRGKLTKMPEALLNYRRPDVNYINSMRKKLRKVERVFLCDSCSFSKIISVEGSSAREPFLYCWEINSEITCKNKRKTCKFYKEDLSLDTINKGDIAEL